MKAIRFFPTLDEYRTFVHEEIVKTKIFQYHPFYRALIDFVIDHRSPLFFEASEEYEFSHFTQYFNFVLMRDCYDDDLIRDMFFMHDFVHMIFDNPLNVHEYSFEQFCEMTTYNEYVASNETETLTYYRIHGLREKSLPYTIMYDLLQHAGHKDQPSVPFLLNVRRNIMLKDSSEGLDGHPDAARVFSFLRKFKENNGLWDKLWYENFPRIDAPYFEKRLCLPLASYDEILLKYQVQNSEAMYQKNMLINIRSALQMIGEKDLPETFADCAEAVKKLEGKVIMNDVAKEFHAMYLKNKNK